ncbi:MAG: polysaccharide lyase family 7 protein [Pirellulaceae bacterium]
MIVHRYCSRSGLVRFAATLLAVSVPAALSGAEPPAKSLDLSRWMLTLPVDTERAGTPDEVKQPELASFVDPRCFFVNAEADGVVFRAPCGGSTTKNSKYPRCELREMTDRGETRAAWDTAGRAMHTMTMRVAVTKTPPVKKHVVCAQIHDADDDLMMVRLEGTKLFIERNDVGDVMLDPEYKLGTPFDLKIQAGERRVQVWHNGELAMNWKVSRQGCYFKAGCYTQSNPSKGDAADAYGETVLYRLQVEHRTRR